MSVLMRLQLGFPDTFSLIAPQDYYQFITMHGMIMVIYLLTALFLGGFGNYLIPLMCGSRDMVFPYMNMLSFWFYLLAVLVLVAGFFVPGGPTGAGWTLYPPQAILPGTPGASWGIICMLASLAIFIVAFTMGGLNYVTTVLQARCRGMTFMRMPLSVWGIFTASILGLLAFPALFVSRDHDDARSASSAPASSCRRSCSMGEQTEHSGGSPLLFQHLFWFFGHPEVYIVALPAFGIVSDLLSTHARRNIFGYRMMVWAILAIGCLSFVVWAHHMYVSGMNPYFGFFFATTTLIIAVPTAIKVYNWVLTIWRGDVHLTVPMLFAIGFIFTFINGGLTGLFLGNVTVDVPLSGTYFVVAHFHMVMGVSPILVVFGAIYHWYPKITGRMLDETLGKIHFWVDVPRHLRDLPADALPRHSRRAAPLLRVQRQHRVHSAVGAHRERVDHDLGGVRRRRAAGVPVQPDLVVLRNGQAVRAESVARDVARMADAGHAAEARQLGQGSAGRASLGLRLQRARRARGLHSAERAARRPSTPAGPRARSADVSLTVAYAALARRHRRLADPRPQAVGEAVGSAGRRPPTRASMRRAARRRASGCGCSSRSSLRCSGCSSRRTTCACGHHGTGPAARLERADRAAGVCG